MREQWIHFEDEIESLDDIYLELLDIKVLADRFYTICILKKDTSHNLMNLFEARTIFESCLTILKGLIDTSDNELINKVHQNYMTHDIMEKYFENFLAILDSEQEKLKNNVREAKLINPFLIVLSVKGFREKLIDYMENLIIIPFMKSFSIYRGEVNNSVNKNLKKKDVFEYILFREVLLSAKIKGSSTRQKISMSSSSFAPTFHETNITKTGKITRTPEVQATMPPDINQLSEMEDFEDLVYEDV